MKMRWHPFTAFLMDISEASNGKNEELVRVQ
jgi:hypothetical protein